MSKILICIVGVFLAFYNLFFVISIIYDCCHKDIDKPLCVLNSVIGVSAFGDSGSTNIVIGSLCKVEKKKRGE